MADPLTYANSDEYVLVNPSDPKVGHLVYDAPMVDAETKQFIRDPKTGKIKVYRMVIWGTKGLTQAQVEALITQKNATLVTRINNLDSTLTNFLDADDTSLDQLSELVAAIKANKINIASLVTDIGKLIDPVSHLPIEATTASVGVVQLATAQDITNGTAGKVVDAKELSNFAQTLPAANGVTDVSSGDNSNQLVVSRIGGSKTLTIDNVEHAGTATSANSVAWGNVSGKPSTFTPSSHTHDDRYYTESEIDTKLSDKANATDLANYLRLNGGNVTGSLTVQNKNVATEDFVNNLNIIRKNDGNDYYDDSDITSLIYAGNGAGTLRNEIANGDFSRVHPGQTIVGRVTGTTYVVVGCNIYKHRGDTELTTNHIGLMPIQLIGNDGNLLWSGRTYAGSGVNNTTQGYAPWASDNDTESKNQTSCYKDSYIANTVLPKVDNLWLKPDFENQGISVLTFRNLEAISFDTNAVCMSNPNWRGCATSWGWNSRRLVLPSEPEIYGHYHWSGSPWESGSQHTQLPLYRHKEIHKVYPRVDIWLKDSASASFACFVASGLAGYGGAFRVFRVCPLFLIA